jgi:Reverse transcriptase (RNA-dependent DNA polymerase)
MRSDFLKHQALKTGQLFPGDCVSLDQYESAVRGRLPSGRGKEPFGHKYIGGTIFCDHASGLISCYHQTSLRANETVQSKRAFEREAKLCGVRIQTYHADNGIFKSQEFTSDLLRLDQTITLSAVGAHHQNGVAERAIRTVTERARAMLHHAMLHWPDETETDLWPYALDYATWLYNHTPSLTHGWAPIELFCGVQFKCSQLQRVKVWGCPTYVLSPTLQDGRKIPKWAPRARRGQFLGFSTQHSSLIGLIRNPSTQHVSPQFHVVHDELFTTVCSVDEDNDTWVELFLSHREYYGPEVDEETEPYDFSNNPAFGEFEQQVLDNIPRVSNQTANIPSETDENLLPTGGLTETAPTLDIQAPISIPKNEPIPQQHAVETKHDTELNTALDPSSDVTVPSVDTKESNKAYDDNSNQSGQTPSLKSPRPTRVRKANPQIFGDEWVNGTISLTPSSRTFIGHIIPNMTHDDIFLHSLDWDAPFAPEYLGYLSIEHIDPFTSEVEWVHPLSMAAKASSADTPTLREIQKMNPEEVDHWYDAMEIELAALKAKNTMTEIPRKQVPAGKQMIKSTWAFRKKRRPNGEIHKYKARFVVRGDLQKLEDTESTYSPVVDWSTVRLLFVLTVAQAHLAT